MKEEKPILRDKSMDNTLVLMTESYRFIRNRARELNSDIFQTRLLGQTTNCVVGEEVACVFYDETKFRRRRAVPKRIQKKLDWRKSHTDDG
ncbi:hypothetical protein ACSFXN_13005 [Planococcus sp. 1R117A]|uniref:hypothetical protein n=1 Tax=Planococcus sp. 1R117A TaxID=3447020 RepID=UPI003EDC5FFC